LRFASHGVNGQTRNPDVLPTFLALIPKGVRHHPQFFPMAKCARAAMSAARRRRAAVVTGIAAALCSMTLAIASVVTIVGVGAPTSGAGAADDALTPLVSSSANTLGAAAGDAAIGLRTPYYDPPALADPSVPGFTVNSGADQPDPFIVVEGGRSYLFTSQDGIPTNVPVRSGPVVGQWGPVSDALPDPPAWATPGVMWAPDVARFGDHYMLYFTTELRGVAPQAMCIGDAVSTAIDGPYLAAGAPFICQQQLGGSIDPRVFVDANGQPSMIWKSDQNARPGSTDTQIYSQPLSADGMHLLGSPSVIFGPDEPWQGHIVEAPQLVLERGAYWLFYSGGWFNQAGYSIGVARCAGPAGPCSDTSPSPLLGSNAQGVGPGEESVFANDAGVWLAYTPFRSTLPLPGPPRPVALAHLGFGPAGPYLAAPLEVSGAS
jgi:hypothetical protein